MQSPHRCSVCLTFVMNLIRIIFFILNVLYSYVIFISAANLWEPSSAINGRITGGHSAKPNGYPYMVSLQLKFLWVRSHFCGGSLLNKNWVLTAGHCITESWLIRMLNMDAVAGAHDVDRFGPEVQIQKIVQRIEHPNYRGGIGPNDIAMLKTENPFVFTNVVQPINLPPEDVDLISGPLVLTGWGVLKTTLFIPQLPSYLQELSVTFVPFAECLRQIDLLAEPNEANPLDKQSNICTGPLDGGKAACVGDSGGPLTLSQNSSLEDNKVERKDADNYLVGVVSWGISPCGEVGAPTVYTTVSKQLDFIKSYINT